MPASTCPTDVCAIHQQYNRTLSSTSHDINADMSIVQPTDQGQDVIHIQFGQGDVTGCLVTDTVCMENSVCKEDFAFLAADDLSQDPFGDNTFDGVLGLGRATLASGDAFSFMSMFGPLLTAPFFAVYLVDHFTGSEITFGEVDPDQYEGEIIWIPCSPASAESGYWQFAIERIYKDDQVIYEPTYDKQNQHLEVVVDTGTSLMAAPDAVVDSIEKGLNLADVSEFTTCYEISTSPRLGLEVGGYIFYMPGEEYFADESGCTLALMRANPDPNADTTDPLMIFGDPILRAFMTVFHLPDPNHVDPRCHDNHCVGFAKAKNTNSAILRVEDREYILEQSSKRINIFSSHFSDVLRLISYQHRNIFCFIGKSFQKKSFLKRVTDNSTLITN